MPLISGRSRLGPTLGLVLVVALSTFVVASGAGFGTAAPSDGSGGRGTTLATPGPVVVVADAADVKFVAGTKIDEAVAHTGRAWGAMGFVVPSHAIDAGMRRAARRSGARARHGTDQFAILRRGPPVTI
jgi:hypothetical protein